MKATLLSIWEPLKIRLRAQRMQQHNEDTFIFYNTGKDENVTER